MKEQLRFSFDSESAETSSNDQSDHPSPTPSHVRKRRGRKNHSPAFKNWNADLKKDPDFAIQCIKHLFKNYEQKVIETLVNIIKRQRKPIEGILNVIKMHLWKFPLDLGKMFNSAYSDFCQKFKKKNSFGERWTYEWVAANQVPEEISYEEYDPGPEYSLQERAVEIYNKKEEWQKAHKSKLLKHRLHEITDIMHQAFEKSDGQGKKSRAGNVIEQIIDVLVLDVLEGEYPQFKYARNVKQKDRSIDRVIENTELDIKVNLSCKHTMRDRLADKDDHIQVIWTDEMKLDTFRFFAENGNLVIIIDEKCRKNAINKMKKHKINLPIYDLLFFQLEIKKLLSL